MQYLMVILIILCIMHYVYQAILLPCYMQNTRDKLFSLRDQLRRRLICIQSECDETTVKAFKEVDDGINRIIQRLDYMTVTRFIRVQIALLEDESKFKKYESSVRDFHDALCNAQDDTPGNVYKRVNRILDGTLVMNSLMLMIYLLPFTILYILAVRLISSVYCQFKRTKICLSELADTQCSDDLDEDTFKIA